MRNLQLSKYSLYTIISILILKLALEYSYFSFVNKYFEYSGFYIDTNNFKLFESIIVTIFLTILLLNIERRNRPSKIVLYILFINLFLPISILYWMMDQERIFFYLVSLFLIFLIKFTYRLKLITLPSITESRAFIFAVLLGITMSVFVYLILTGGLSRINLNLLNVYETRAAYVDNNIMLFGYLVPWQAYIINLFFMVYGLFTKRKIIVIGAILLEVFLFSMTNSKSFLFAPLVVIGLYLIFKGRFKDKSLFVLANILSISLILLHFIYIINKDILLLSIFLRRLFFVPASLHYTYYDYFTGKEKYYLSNSVFEGIINSSYSHGPVKEVALKVFGKDFSPNVGVVGDAYLNFGGIGIILFGIILGLYLVLLDSVTSKVNIAFSIPLIAIPSMALVNSALFTSFMTHGLLFALFILWFTNSLFKKELG